MPANLKRKRVKLSNGAYRKLAKAVLERDGHTCQYCGCWTNSPPHHVVFRSQGGDDSMENLKLYCCKCHRSIHDGKIKLSALEG